MNYGEAFNRRMCEVLIGCRDQIIAEGTCLFSFRVALSVIVWVKAAYPPLHACIAPSPQAKAASRTASE